MEVAALWLTGGSLLLFCELFVRRYFFLAFGCGATLAGLFGSLRYTSDLPRRFLAELFIFFVVSLSVYFFLYFFASRFLQLEQPDKEEICPK